MTTKQRIMNVFLAGTFTDATSYDIYEWFSDTVDPVSPDTIDRNLKELVESNLLAREKKANANGRQVYHYDLASTQASSVDNDAEIDPNHTEVEEVPTQTTGPKTIFIVRNKLGRSSYGAWASTFSRTLSTFDRTGRRFQEFGNAVISVMMSDASPENIVGALEDANLGITYEVVSTLADAIETLKLYTPNIQTYQIQDFVNFATGYFSRYIAIESPKVPVQETPKVEIPSSNDNFITVKKSDLLALRAIAERMLGENGNR